MPQNVVSPYMARKMVDRTHRVKPRLYRRPDPSRPESAASRSLALRIGEVNASL